MSLVTTTTTRRRLAADNIFGMKGDNWEKYDEIVVRTRDKESGHSAEMSFFWSAHRDQAGEAYDTAHKTCVDNTVSAVVSYLKAKSTRLGTEEVTGA